MRDSIPTLELMRDNAAADFDAAGDLSLMRFLKQNTQAIERAVAAMTKFKLAPLDQSRVRRLLPV